MTTQLLQRLRVCSLWIVLWLALSLTIGAPLAYGDSFTPIFTTVGCMGNNCAVPIGSVTMFTPETGTFTSLTFSGLTDSSVFMNAGEKPTDQYNWEVEVVASTIPPFPLELDAHIDESGGVPPMCTGVKGISSCGTLTWAPVPTPEPSSLILAGTVLLGMGLLYWRRKKVSPTRLAPSTESVDGPGTLVQVPSMPLAK